MCDGHDALCKQEEKNKMIGRLPRQWVRTSLSRLARMRRRREEKVQSKRRRASSSLHDRIATEAAANLLASPPPPTPAGLVVSHIPRRGRALVAARNFRKGETLVAEAPLVSVPMADDCLACNKCRAFIGSEQLHLELAAGRIALCDARAEAAHRGRARLCSDCGVLYCSLECRATDVSCGHRLLCAGAVADEAAAAWALFHEHAREEAELPELVLAARLLAAVLISETPASTDETRRACIALQLVQEPCADVLFRDAAGAEGAAMTLREVATSCALCERAMLLTCAAAGVPSSLVRRRCQMEGPNSFGNLVGLVLLNQVAVVGVNPAHARVARLAAASAHRDGPERQALVKLMPLVDEARARQGLDVGDADAEKRAQRATKQSHGSAEGNTAERLSQLRAALLEEEPASFLPPLDDTGLSYFVCLMNHSWCALPSCQHWWHAP